MRGKRHALEVERNASAPSNRSRKKSEGPTAIPKSTPVTGHRGRDRISHELMEPLGGRSKIESRPRLPLTCARLSTSPTKPNSPTRLRPSLPPSLSRAIFSLSLSSPSVLYPFLSCFHLHRHLYLFLVPSDCILALSLSPFPLSFFLSNMFPLSRALLSLIHSLALYGML